MSRSALMPFDLLSTWARASASSEARIARWALCKRERTVPGGMPRISAISLGA